MHMERKSRCLRFLHAGLAEPRSVGFEAIADLPDASYRSALRWLRLHKDEVAVCCDLLRLHPTLVRDRSVDALWELFCDAEPYFMRSVADGQAIDDTHASRRASSVQLGRQRQRRTSREHSADRHNTSNEHHHRRQSLQRAQYLLAVGDRQTTTRNGAAADNASSSSDRRRVQRLVELSLHQERQLVTRRASRSRTMREERLRPLVVDAPQTTTTSSRGRQQRRHTESSDASSF